MNELKGEGDSDATPGAASLPPPGLLELWYAQTDDQAVIFLSLDAKVVCSNRAVERVLGYEPAELVGQTLRRIFSEEDLARGLDAYELEVARALGRSEDDRWHIGKADRRVWASGVLMALRDDAGRHVGYVKVLRDRTDQRTQIAALENRLAQARDAVNRTNDAQATLGHELRNPIHTLANTLEILKTALAGTAQEPTLAIIKRQLSILERLSWDLTGGARPGSSGTILSLEVVDLLGILRSVTALHSDDAKARDIELMAVLPNAAISIEGDSIRLEQIFRNLLANAIKYTHPGGHVSVTATVEGQTAVVRVQDDGIGMSASVLPDVFDLFTREDRAIETADGLGIGLALVKNLVRLHQGFVEVQSAGPDRGSEFTVRLPLHLSAMLAGG